MGITQFKNEIILTEEQIEILNGALLGDGSLYKHKNGKNAQFIYTTKSKQHIEFIAKYFKEYISGEQIREDTIFDKRTLKEYTRNTFKTYTNKIFTKYYNQWYINSTKKNKIPNNLILTPLTCLIWYIGDGCISHNDRSENIKLATQCFSKEDQENILLPQLQQFEATLIKANYKNNVQQYSIYIPHRQEENFLNYIGQCPFSDYQYKWNITKYKNKLPQDNYQKYEKEFCDEYLLGINYYQIAKKRNIQPNVVKYYLMKNNIYIPPNLKSKNAILQLDNNDNIINIYSSMGEAGKAMGFSGASMISKIYNGQRKNTTGYKWKKYSDYSKEEQELIQQQFKNYFNN